MTAATMEPTYTPGAIYLVDPQILVFEDNVRVPKPTDAMVQTVRVHGILQPVTVYVSDQGSLMVRDGQHRTLAAREAQCAQIPVYVISADTDAKSRITTQLVANDQRVALTPAQRAQAVRQLSFEGMDVKAIAKSTGMDAGSVDTALVVTAKPKAAAAMDALGLTLEDAALWAEFEDDPKTIAKLDRTLKYSGPGQLAHTAEMARQENARELRRKQSIKQLRDEGVTLVEKSWWEMRAALRLRELYAKAGAKKKLTAEAHAICPGHMAVMDYDGRIEYGCASWRKHGHVSENPSDNVASSAASMTAEERRAVRENNVAMEAAQVVRRQWVGDFLRAAKSAPKGFERFVAEIFINAFQDLSDRGVRRQAEELLGLSTTTVCALAAYLDASQSPVRAQITALATAIGAVEAISDKTAWRKPRQSFIRYLALIKTWGYPLAEVEQAVITEHEKRTAKTATAKTAAAKKTATKKTVEK